MKPPKYVQQWIDKKTGRPQVRLRLPGRKSVPLPGLPWSPTFMEAYEAAMTAAGGSQVPAIGSGRTKVGTVNDALVRYYTHTSFTNGLEPSTQANRRAIFERFREKHGDKRIATLRSDQLAAMLSPLRPHAQRNWMKALRGLMAFAKSQGLIDVDPTQGVRTVRIKDTGGFHSWDETEIAKFEQQHPVGTKARLALALLFNTGGARVDVVRMGPQHIRKGVLSFKRQKTGVDVVIPVLSELQSIIAATPSGNLAFLVTEQGKPFTPAGFGNWFRDRCDEAGLPQCSAHGLRKAAANRFAVEHGATTTELMAWFGWSTATEAERYTKAANRVRAARALGTRTEIVKPATRFDNSDEKISGIKGAK